jgi:hypothetical protein
MDVTLYRLSCGTRAAPAMPVDSAIYHRSFKDLFQMSENARLGRRGMAHAEPLNPLHRISKGIWVGLSSGLWWDDLFGVFVFLLIRRLAWITPRADCTR